MRHFFSIVLFSFLALIFASTKDLSAQSRHLSSDGVYNLTELNLGYGLQGNVQPNEIGFTGISTLVGYWLTRSLSAGLGAGILAYNGSNAIPLYFEGGYYFRPFGLGKTRFFIKADAGLLFRLNGDVEPVRVFGNPNAGLQIPLARHKDISISLGFFSQFEQKLQNNYQQYQLTNFVNAKVGLRFY